jgi:formate dehydrogenase maturation protein FdhE
LLEQEALDAQDAYEAARGDLQAAAVDARSLVNTAITDATDEFAGVLSQAEADMAAEIARAKAALETKLQERLDLWQEKHDWELDQAKWQRDSYWRYHLIKLLNAKDDAVKAAINMARSDFAGVMAEESDESLNVRAEQRQALVDFAAQLRLDLAAVIDEDIGELEAEIEVRDMTFTDFLDGLLDGVNAELDAVVEAFVEELDSAYNYIDVEQYGEVDALTVAPYTEYQHRNFVLKFNFWLDG